MEIIFLLLPITLFIALLGLGVYIWSVRTGQYDDLDTPPLRILGEDENRTQAKTPPIEGDNKE